MRGRVVFGAIAVVALICVLIARLYFLQVIQYEYHSTLSENNRVHVQPIPPTRGLIFDRNGVVVADNRPSFSLSMTRERSGDWQQVLDVIVEVLELTPEDRVIFEKRMRQGRRPFEPVPILFELTEEQIARIAVNQFRLPGVEVVAQLVRHYPQGAHFAHSVGYMGRINEKELKSLDPVNYSGTHHIGKTGIERFYEPELHGQVGYEEVETNARGRVLRVLKRTDPIPGKDIVLSLDIKLQEAAEAALGGRRGAVVALDPKTGEVLAMVSAAEFRPEPVRHRHQLQGLCRAARFHRPAAVQPRAAWPVPAGFDHQAGGGDCRPGCRRGDRLDPGVRPRLLPVAQLRSQIP